MAKISVLFRYLTGIKREIFHNARLIGSWDGAGHFAANWSETPMVAGRAEDGCPCFTACVELDDSEIGTRFHWGVRLDAPGAPNVWGITTEIADGASAERYREFALCPAGSGQSADFYLTYAQRLGARKFYADGSQAPDLRFSLWAPNAREIDVVFGIAANGYIADDGDGIDSARPIFKMTRGANDIWDSDAIKDFAAFEGAPYMFRVRNAQGQIVYRTDLFARDQIGRGGVDPNGGHYTGNASQLDGTKSCSVVTGADTVAAAFADRDGARIPAADFWANEFTAGLAVPSRVEDLIIYELHVNALGFGQSRPGNLKDAVDLLPYLGELGVNAVELMPMSEFSGGLGWGYGDSHYFVIEASAGGRDEYKHFVRACHRRGIAVIQDVCYNHYDFNAARDEWQYDSTAPEDNIFYWYEGKPSDYSFPEGGYIDNGSSGWAPRYWEEIVRHLFVSSAADFVEEFHVDGLRVDLTQALHRDNALHADGRPVASANQFGIKLLREWSRTLRLIKPAVMLIAEDHTGWDAVTRLPDAGGLGFDATWFADFYHNLIGDSEMAGGKARLLKNAGLMPDGGLDIEQFAGTLSASQFDKIVYHESHDEAGNDAGTARTLVCAVNDAPLIGLTRDYAEARSRVAFGLALLSGGAPMFFMGEEIGAQKPYRFDTFFANREDLAGERAGTGGKLFRYYQDLIRFSRTHAAARSQEIDIVHALGANRVIAFTRSAGSDQLLVVASLRNQPFADGYIIQTDATRLPDGMWREVFNSDAAIYGGNNFGNFGIDISVAGGRFQCRIPANGLLIFEKL